MEPCQLQGSIDSEDCRLQTNVTNLFYFTHFFIIADFDENEGTCSKRKRLSQIAVHHQTTLFVGRNYVRTKLMPKTTGRLFKRSLT